MPDKYHCKELSINISAADMQAYYDFHKRLMAELGKTPKSFEDYRDRALILLALPTHLECVIYKEGIIIGWLSAYMYESDNNRKCISFNGELLEKIDDPASITSFKELLDKWKQISGADAGSILVATEPKKKIADLLNGQYLDERLFTELKIAEIDNKLLDRWMSDADMSDLNERFFTALPEEYIDQFVTCMNNGLNDIPTQMRRYTQYANAEAERKMIIERSKGGRTHLLMMLTDNNDKLVAMTNVTIHPQPTAAAFQWMTYCIPEIRGKGLVKYLKASMMKQIISNYPHVTIMNTDCFIKGVAMRHINDQMGYSYKHTEVAYEVLL